MQPFGSGDVTPPALNPFKGKFDMRKMILALSAATMVVSTVAIPSSADARKKRYAYREWRDDSGRTRCRKPDGTVGTIVGGVAGALVGRTIDTRGDRTVGTVLGAAGGALIGNEVAKSGSRRCR